MFIMKLKLTAKTSAALELPPGKDEGLCWDTELTNFGLRLRRARGSGRPRKTWIVQYRSGGRQRRMKIGAFEKLTTDQARTAATKILAQVDLGGDPQGDKSERRRKDAQSFKTVVSEYLAVKEESGGMRPHSLQEVRRYLTQGYFATLHPMPIDRIARRDVALRVQAITRESGAPTADHARSALSAFFTWCLAAGIVDSNPTIGATRPELPPARDRVLSDHELAAVWRESGDGAYGAIIRLLILLAARRAEIGGMQWGEVDLENGTWELPAERSKNGLRHVLPLPRAAIDIINSVPRRVDRDYLFGSRANVGFTLWSQEKRALDRRLAGQLQPWHLHDLRRSAATKMADIGIAPHLIEEILNHRSGHRVGVAGIYNRSSYEQEVRAAMAMWDDHIRALIGRGERKVVPMRQVS
jgi:integrase